MTLRSGAAIRVRWFSVRAGVGVDLAKKRRIAGVVQKLLIQTFYRA